MPITVGARLRTLAEAEFKAIAYAAMQHVFAVHREMGGLLEEVIYQRELVRRIRGAEREVPIQVSFEDFVKTYYLDIVIGGGAVFELKAVDQLGERHRSQLLNYLFFTGLPHGKLVNMRPDRVQHEFVNAPLVHEERTAFDVETEDWRDPAGCRLQERMVAAILDWGTGLDLNLYQEAASHFCGRAAEPESPVEIRVDEVLLGTQSVRLASSESALRVTCLPTERRDGLETHLRQFLNCTSLQSIHWINITRPLVRFKTIRRTASPRSLVS